MTITSQIVRSGPLVPNGVTVTFPFSFQVKDESQVGVQIDGVAISKSLFTVELNEDGTGSATFAVAPVGAELFLVSEPSFDQQDTFRNQGPYFQETVENRFDEQTMAILWLLDRVVAGVDTQTVLDLLAANGGAARIGTASGDNVQEAIDALLAGAAAAINADLVKFTRADVSAVETDVAERLERVVYAEDWGVTGDNSATALLADDTVVTMAQAVQNCLDEAPLGSTIVWPNGPINMGAASVNQTRWLNHRFSRGTDMRFTKPTTDDAPGFRVNVAKDVDLGITENRNMMFEGNGGRIWIYTPADMGGTTFVNEGGNFALTIGDGWDEGEADGSDYTPNIGIAFFDLRLGGGKLGAAYLTGPNPYDLPGGVSYPETHFVRFYRCLFDGGVYDESSDGNIFVDCNCVGDDFCAFTFDKVPGAYNTLVMGGTSNCGKGNFHVINGDMVWMVRHQAEITFSYGNSTAPYGAQAIFQGLDRPVTRSGVIGCNFGSGDRITNTVALENTEHVVLMDCQFGPAKLVSGGGSDIYLGDNAKHTHLIRPQLRGPEMNGAVELRTVQPRGVMTDASRRLRISSESTPHRNPHFGLWLQCGAIMGDPDDADDGSLLNSWIVDATAGLEVMLDGERGIAHLGGALSGGDLSAAVCTWPDWMRPTFDTRIACLSDGGVTSRPLSASGGIGAGTALPDAKIWFDGVSWPIRPDVNYHAGTY